MAIDVLKLEERMRKHALLMIPAANNAEYRVLQAPGTLSVFGTPDSAPVETVTPCRVFAIDFLKRHPVPVAGGMDSAGKERFLLAGATPAPGGILRYQNVDFRVHDVENQPAGTVSYWFVRAERLRS